ncbi:MAG TPA: FAD:protein FMN transferase [Thermoleophilaceae bacterium]
MSGADARWDALGSSAAVAVSDAAALPAARAAVEDELAALDVACSRFRDDSELSRLNAGRGRRVPASPLFLEAVEVALRAAALTGGIVDPTVGEALVAAGYSRDFSELRRGPAELRAQRVPGWTKVHVDRARRAVRVPPGVRLDLGATAKALGADRAAAAAARAAPGVSVLVNLGGDIGTAGPPLHGGWLVRVADDHRASADAPGQTLTIAAGGLATSSTTVRRWGPGRHHIIDPRSGLPALSRWRTVSVAAATCVDANIASTAAIVLGDEAPAWLSERGLPARLVSRNGHVLTVAAWPEELVAA